MFCWSSSLNCTSGTFAPASVPLYNEQNVGFSQSFAALYLTMLPANHGIVLVNTAVSGTGFYGGNWFTSNQGLTAQMLTALNFASSSIGTQLGGTPQFDLFLWHQGEEDAGDNGAGYSAPCWYYLRNDIGPFIDFVRANSPGASPTTPFVVGGLLPYWLSQVSGAHGVEIALYTINATRAYTATADSSIFPNYLPNSIPDGDPGVLSAYNGLVMNFNATQAVVMGQQFFNAYQQAVVLTTPTTAATSDTGCGAPPSPSAVAYTNRAGMNASSNFTANSLSYIVWGQNSSLCVQGVQPVASVQLTLQLCSVGSIAQMWNVTSTGFAVAANSGPSPYYFNSIGACGANHALYEYPVANPSSLSTSALATIVVSYSTYQQITLCGYCVDALISGSVGTALTVQLCNYTASVSSQQFQFAPARLPSPPAAVAYINAAGMNASSNYTANSLSYIVWGQNSSLCVQGVQPVASVQLTLQLCSVGSIAQMWNVTSTGFAVAANSGPTPYYFNSNGACGVNHALYEYPVANLSSLSALSLATIVVGYSTYQQITLCGYCVDALISGSVGTALTIQLCNYTASVSSQQFQFAPAHLPPPPAAVAYINAAGMNASSNYTANSLSYIVWGQNSSLCVQGVQPVASVQLTLQLCSVGSIAQMWNVTSTGFAVAANSGPTPYYFNSNGACGVNHALYEVPVANPSSLSASVLATIVVGYSAYQQITLCGYCVDPLISGSVGTALTVQLCNYTSSISSQQFQFAPAAYAPISTSSSSSSAPFTTSSSF